MITVLVLYYINIQLMTLDEVNTTIYQPQRSDYHRGHRPTLDEVNTTIYQPRDLIITEAIGRGDNQISGLINRGIN